jgi:hypothetical protein
MKRILCRAALVLTCVTCGACDERGVEVGTEEACQLDPRLLVAEERSGPQGLPACAHIAESRLVDGDFEVPVVGDCTSGTFCALPAWQVPGWDTTGELQQIEVWSDGHMGVPAPEANQFAELDATTQDTLFQDVALMSGQLMYWSFLHRGRKQPDTLELLIGPPDAPISQGLFESPSDTWTFYSGLYSVGDESVTRFALASRSGISEGNLVDAVVFAPVE